MRPFVVVLVFALAGIGVARALTPRAQPTCACAHHALVLAPPTTSDLDGASLYQIGVPLTDSRGHAFSLASLRGEPVLVAMVYTSCTTICPLLVSDLRRIDEALGDARDRVRVVLVTLDPEHDTTERLAAFAAERGLPLPRWTVVRPTSDADVRELAVALGVQYRRLAGGQIVHSALVTLLDGEGRIVLQRESTDDDIEPIAARTRALAASGE
jgi:protein SCO1/2